MAVAQAELPLRQPDRLILHAVQEGGGEQAGPVGAGLAMGERRIFQPVGHVEQLQHPVLRRRAAGIEAEIDMGETELPAGGDFLAVGGEAMPAAQVYHRPDSVPAGPAAQLGRRRLAGPEQARRHAMEPVEDEAEDRVIAEQRVRRRARRRSGRDGRPVRRSGVQAPCRRATSRL